MPYVNQPNEIKIIPTVFLQTSKNDLKEMVVTIKRQILEVKPDKMVVNVEGTINAVGSDAIELIRKAPGVAVEQNEKNKSLCTNGSVFVGYAIGVKRKYNTGFNIKLKVERKFKVES